ncbi:MAG TPA: hypothetical protein VKQ27_12380 [Acetobacteraceae bacterium]|nr:hypothetical protein [Acetobacteraceae bacterium]
MSGLNWDGSKDLQRHKKIESLVRGLQETFGSRAEEIAREQFGAATAGSEAAKAWHLILDELAALPRPGQPPAAEPQQP